MGQTPYLRLDVARMEANLAAAAHSCAQAGVGLRPHAKTHKCPQIAERQLAAGAVGLTVATIGEAEVFAGGGARDLFIGYPLWGGRDGSVSTGCADRDRSAADDRLRQCRGRHPAVRTGRLGAGRAGFGTPSQRVCPPSAPVNWPPN